MKFPKNCEQKDCNFSDIGSQYDYKSATNSETESQQNSDFGLSDVFTMSTSQGAAKSTFLQINENSEIKNHDLQMKGENITNSDNLGELSNLDSQSLGSNISQ